MCFQIAGAPAESEILVAQRSALMAGGKGFNQAVAAKRLNTDVKFITSMANDPASELAIATLLAEGFAASDLYVELQHGRALTPSVILTSGNDVRGVIGPAHTMPTAPLTALQHAYREIARADVVLLTYDFGKQMLRAVIDALAAARGKPLFIVNPAPIFANAEWTADRLTCIDWLVPNRGEAELIVPGTLDIGQRARELAIAISGSVCVTLGSDGYMYAANTPPSDQRLPVVHRAFEVDVVDTTGASDAFCAALAVWLAEGNTPPDALRAAAAAGALAARTLGTSSSMPRRANLETFLRRHR